LSWPQLSFVAEDYKGHIIGYVLAKMWGLDGPSLMTCIFQRESDQRMFWKLKGRRSWWWTTTWTHYFCCSDAVSSKNGTGIVTSQSSVYPPPTHFTHTEKQSFVLSHISSHISPHFIWNLCHFQITNTLSNSICEYHKWCL
jgi:hypothetical protein